MIALYFIQKKMIAIFLILTSYLLYIDFLGLRREKKISFMGIGKLKVLDINDS